MDTTEVTQLISTVGFPIVAFIMMYWMCNTTIKENSQSTSDLKDAINKLNDRLDGTNA
jgi:hypothetical protein